MAWLIPVVFALASLACVLTAIGIPVYQAYGWLRTAHWEPFPIPFSPPYSEWEGVNRILDWVWSIHPSVHLAIGAWWLALIARGEQEGLSAQQRY
jgi:hypothetical protein